MSKPTLLAAAALSAALSPMAVAAQEIDGRLPGVWTMVSLEVADASGAMQAIPYSGQIIFTADGHMAVQAMNPDAAAADTPYTRHGYEAQYGRIVVDEANQAFTLTIESALVRGQIGQELHRRYEFSGEQLILLPADPSEGFRVTYEQQMWAGPIGVPAHYFQKGLILELIVPVLMQRTLARVGSDVRHPSPEDRHATSPKAGFVIPVHYAPVLFGLLLSGFMSLIVSGLSTVRTLGMVDGLLLAWTGNWLASWAMGFPIVLVVAPVVRRIVARLTASPGPALSVPRPT